MFLFWYYIYMQQLSTKVTLPTHKQYICSMDHRRLIETFKVCSEKNLFFFARWALIPLIEENKNKKAKNGKSLIR